MTLGLDKHHCPNESKLKADLWGARACIAYALARVGFSSRTREKLWCFSTASFEKLIGARA